MPSFGVLFHGNNPIRTENDPHFRFVRTIPRAHSHADPDSTASPSNTHSESKLRPLGMITPDFLGAFSRGARRNACRVSKREPDLLTRESNRHFAISDLSLILG